MDIEEITIEISPDGKLEIIVQGVKGPECLDLTAELIEKLGGEINLQEKTSEFYEPPREDTGLDQTLRR